MHTNNLVKIEHGAKRHGQILLLGLCALIIAAVVWQARVTNARNLELENKIVLLASTTASLSHSINLISEELKLTKNENSVLTSSLASQLAQEQANVANFQNQIQTIGSTVGTLDKLSRLDPELLKKYSKVFFLNENYVPANLLNIDSRYLYSETKPERLEAEVLPSLHSMMGDALSGGVKLYVKSAYRSFFEQASLKGTYSVIYGAGTANTFSADQGYSEHQMGTTVDFVTAGMGGNLDGFEDTEAYRWLQNNAYRYGFVLSYPKGNSYYVFEPWHWRYVGKALALRLHNEGRHFYDLDQRDIDGYLIKIFDN